MPDVVDVVLVRHAATAWTGVRFCGVGDPSLTEDGRRVAVALAAELAATLPTGARIVTSPRRRARATADAIAAALGERSIDVDERWAETDFGAVEGRTFAEVEALDPALAAALLRGDTAIDWPGGESAAALAERVRLAWGALAVERRPVVVVSHAGPLRIAIALADGVAPAAVQVPSPGSVVRRAIGRRTR